MSVRVMSWVFEHSRATLADRLVLLAIADHANDRGLDAWPSVETIARKAGVSESTAHRALIRLTELEEIAVERAVGPKGTNHYRVLMRGCQSDTPKGCQSDTGGVSSTRQGGVIHDEKGVSLVTPEPSFEPSLTIQSLARAREGCAGLNNLTPTAIHAKPRPQ